MYRVSAVSYLNALPLIWGLEEEGSVELLRRVPSKLLSDLESGAADMALCPVIDYQRSEIPLKIVPVGAIGSIGRTLTVKLYSRLPFEDISTIAVDPDSHTSVALLHVIFDGMFGRSPVLEEASFRKKSPLSNQGDAVLLIGDKVIEADRRCGDYPHQLDLGRAWLELTGRPFVFAVWMCQADARLGPLPDVLGKKRRENLLRLDQLIPRWAAAYNWPENVAREYLTDLLVYSAGPEQIEAIGHFWSRCARLGLIPPPRPCELY